MHRAVVSRKKKLFAATEKTFSRISSAFVSALCGYVISLRENHITIDIQVLFFSLRFEIALEALFRVSRMVLSVTSVMVTSGAAVTGSRGKLLTEI